MRALWNGTVVAESDDTVVVEGNHYFPRSSVKDDVLAPSAKQTFCPWKGQANYQSVTVDGKTAADALWFYPEPKKGAEAVADRVAFWNGVTVEE
jgi:uncharacterized protein (DUF427 family)